MAVAAFLRCAPDRYLLAKPSAFGTIEMMPASLTLAGRRANAVTVAIR